MAQHYTESELKSWVEICLSKENITEIVVNIVGYSEKGDGYLGDVIFVHVTGKAEDGLPKEYDLVLKCSKNSKILRETSPIKTIFINEIYVYENVLPAFTKFQLARGIEESFNNFPKCYGTFITEEREVIALEDLKKSGYGLWEKTKPMTRNHINLVVEQYAKFHAISVAMQDQLAEEYAKLTEPFDNLFKDFENRGIKMLENFACAIEDVYEVLQGDLDENILLRWRNFGSSVTFALMKMMQDPSCLKVVNHGDCWNNNFLFQTEEDPKTVSILDWQIAKQGSPVSDLSHFLFTCSSEDDLNDVNKILDEYYRHFSNYLRKLKTDPDVYPKKQLLEDWKLYSKLGIAMASIVMKVCTVGKEEIPDITEAAEDGDFTKAFRFNVKNKTGLKNRMKHVVKYVVENNLI